MFELSRHLVLVGTTASGKSSIAVELAKRTEPNSKIISLDSMQIYKGMEIGTGAMATNERQGIIHHMIGFVKPTQEHTVKQFQNEVYKILKNSPDEKYILTGGTGLYTHAIIDGYNFAPTNPDIRKSIIERHGLDEHTPDLDNVSRAYELLVELDPDAADKIDPLNVRRIVRALEAIEIGELKFSQSGQGVKSFGKPVFDVTLIGLRYSREKLRERIISRIDQMFEQGWVREVKALIPVWDNMSAPARHAIGFGLIQEWIEQGENINKIPRLKQQIANKTAQFSRRQRKWFERDPRITWLECDDLDESQMINRVVELSKKSEFYVENSAK